MSVFTNSNIDFIIPEKKKYDKNGMGSDKIKALFYHHESQGYAQTSFKEEKFTRLWNLAIGRINPEDYFGQELPEELGFKPDALDDHGLSFYPIIPVLRNAVQDTWHKSYIEYYAQAVNKENTNEIIEATNSELRNALVSKANQLFLSENPNVTEEQFNLFQESEKIVNAKRKDFKTTVEQWANHMIRVEDAKFDMKQIGSDILDQIFVTDSPAVHINYHDGDYYPEVWKSKDTFYLRNPFSRDYSDSQMVGNFNYLSFGGAINKWASKIDDEAMDMLEKWNGTYSNGFVINGQNSFYTGNRLEDQESTQNYLTFKSLERGTDRRYEDFTNNFIRETTIYFLVPRKAYRLTYKSSNVTFEDIVDDSFKVTYKPIYKKGEKRSKYSLIEGEHIEPFYFNELWRGITLTPNTNLTGFNTRGHTGERVWIELNRHDIQYSDRQFRYGVRIPVHGGSVNNYYNDSFSPTERCASWQIMYNWVWNRNSQLLATEIGKFFVMNQNMIPHESMEESWGKNNLMKWLLTGRDASIAPIDTSVGHLGQTNLQTGIGQIVDLTKTDEILQKAELARLIKIECYSLMGLTEEYLYGNISTNQTATSVAAGLQRSSSQIQGLYNRLNEVMTAARNTMLETAQYIASNNPTSQLSYVLSDGARHIFETNTSGFLLHKINVELKTSVEDADVLQQIKQNAIANNTMGANTLEMAGMQAAKSVPEMMYKLEEINLKKEREVREQREHESRMQQEQFQNQQALLERTEQMEREKEERGHEKDILVAQIRALGYGNSTASEITNEFVNLEQLKLKQQQHQENMDYRHMLSDFKERQFDAGERNKDLQRRLQEKMKLKELAQKDRELDIREREAKNTDERTDKM